jgi:ammonium transporter, Amt family
VATYIIGTIIQKTIGFRITEEEEVTGIDTVAHAESAYDFTSLGGGSGHTAPLAGQARAEARNTEGVSA